MDKISIITATYNCVDEIEMSIKSVLEQDYPNIEYIIIDGASTDGTVDIIKKYADRISYWISEPDKGLYYAMNKGIEVATGDWMHIHNAGGVFASKNAISQFFSNNLENVDAAFGYIYSKSTKRKERNPIPFYECKGKMMRPGYSHQALFIRSHWMKNHPFDVSYRCCADFNQAVTIYRQGAKFKYVDVYIYISAPAGFSANNRRTQFIENARINGIENTLWFKYQLAKSDLKNIIKGFIKWGGDYSINHGIAIVFGNDHTNTVGLVQSVGKAGFRCIALIFGNKTGFVKSSKFVDKVITGKDPQECIDKLLREPLVGEGKLPILAGSDNCALHLEKNADLLKEHYVFEHTTGELSIAEILDKKLQVKLAIEAGFNVPQSIEFSDASTLPVKEMPFAPPYIFKPLVSLEGCKGDITICRSLDALNKNLAKTLKHTRVLVQQYIERDYEISILGCGLSNGETLIPAVENKLTLYPKYVGLECLANMQPLTDKNIDQSIRNLIKCIGYVGLFSVEMMHCKTDGKFYFTEINPRNDGAESFVTQYGANLPLNHIEDLLGQSLTPMKETHPGYYIWDFHQFQSVLHRDMSIAQFIKEWRMSNGALMYMKGDTKPFYKQYTNWFLEKIKLRKKSEY